MADNGRLCRYIIVQLGLLGPLLQVSRTVYNEVSCCSASASDARTLADSVQSHQVHRIAIDKLREAFKDVQPQLETPHSSRRGEVDEKPRSSHNGGRSDPVSMLEK